MKRMLRRLAAFLCALALLLPLPSFAVNTDGLYFVAVNDVILDLTADSIPVWMGGRLYVPTTVLESSFTGVNLDVYVSNNRAQGFVLLYNRSNSLSFDIAAGTCTDQSQESYPYSALIRNGRTYIPLAFVAEYFGLSYIIMDTDYVPLLRITNGAQKLSNSQFLVAADSPMQSRYDRYIQSVTPAAPVTPSTPSNPTPSTPTPSTPSTPAQPTPATAPETDDTGEPGVVTVRLALRCDDAASLEAMLNALDGKKIYALFLLDPALPAARPDLMRHLVGAGHRAGFYVADEADFNALPAANQALFNAARTESFIVSSADSAMCAQLQAQRWYVWLPEVYASGSAANAVQQSASSALTRAGDTLRLELTGSGAAGALPSILNTLGQETFPVSPVTES